MSFNIATMVRESARSHPDKPALLFDGGRLTYRQLDALSDTAADGLRRRGVQVGDRVGLQLPNIPQFVIAYFAILKVGAVVVPMNVLLKHQEIAHQLSDCGPDRRPGGARAEFHGRDDGHAVVEARARRSSRVCLLPVWSKNAGAPVTWWAIRVVCRCGLSISRPVGRDSRPARTRCPRKGPLVRVGLDCGPWQGLQPSPAPVVRRESSRQRGVGPWAARGRRGCPAAQDVWQ
jgi:hypothetical protein